MLVLVLFLVPLIVFGQEQYAIKLDEKTSPLNFAIKHNLKHIKNIGDWSIFQTKDHTYSPSLFLYDSSVLHAEKQVKKQQHKRQEDPLYNSQWHLHKSVYNVGFDEQSERKGTGVKLAIVDDGLQHAHSDLSHAYSARLSYDFNGHRPDPTPNVYADNGHGTAAAGVCCATEHNAHCGRGVAPGVTLAGIRLIAAGTYDYQEAEGLDYKSNEIDIYSCSWGPEDSGQDLAGPGRVTHDTLFKNFREGRGGKGTVYVWAGGNGRYQHDNGNYDGYANHPATIAIGALNYEGKQSWYSEDCACLFAVAPSSGTRGKGIVTVDLTGPAGYSSGECTDSFGGTSSAAPLAAGVLALLLEERPELTNRDIMHIIAKASTKIDEENPDWSSPVNNYCYSHSHHYGFGLLQVPKLLAETKTHTLVPQQKVIQSSVIREHAVNGIIHIPTLESLQFIEQVVAEINFSHPHRGNVRITLQHPETQVVSILADERPDRHSAKTWKYSSVRHWGSSNPVGIQWVLKLESLDGYIPLFNWAQLTVYGY